MVNVLTSRRSGIACISIIYHCSFGLDEENPNWTILDSYLTATKKNDIQCCICRHERWTRGMDSQLIAEIGREWGYQRGPLMWTGPVSVRNYCRSYTSPFFVLFVLNSDRSSSLHMVKAFSLPMMENTKHGFLNSENGTILCPKGKGKCIMVSDFLLRWSRLNLLSLPRTRQQELLGLGIPPQSSLNTGRKKAIGMAKCYILQQAVSRLFQSPKHFTQHTCFSFFLTHHSKFSLSSKSPIIYVPLCLHILQLKSLLSLSYSLLRMSALMSSAVRQQDVSRVIPIKQQLRQLLGLADDFKLNTLVCRERVGLHSSSQAHNQ
jgi:hypothetical protein